ncbi:MAG TPA: sigma-70 family RNA polymerase sigma factor [Gemmatimonadaceae bacterium]|nr:sigma-70 family RNA polymerase sigma factor [Gemmatimonadaceae bacterium]
MSEAGPERIRAEVEQVYRAESRRVLASLIRLLGDFDRAEEALHDAFAAAMQQWPERGVPANPRTWLVSAGRFKAIDAARRAARFDASQGAIADGLELRHAAQPELDDESLDDDWLRLIFTCCHPALSPDARIALTLREVCDLTTEQVARAFLSTPPTIAQRIVRAKAKIRDAGIPYAIPTRADMPERLDEVLHVVYLVFNEGYAATSGDAVVRAELTREAIRLGRLLLELLPHEGEVSGLLALMLLHDSRRMTRTTASGEIALLGEQDRRLWDRGAIAEGAGLVERAMRTGRFGPYAVQAAIAALHAEAPSAEATDWAQIAGLYDVLLRIEPTPIVELNRAVAVAMRDGAAAGLALADEILARGELASYHLAHAARADLLARLGRRAEAIDAYERALALATQEPERRFLARRMAELSDEL